MLASKEDFAAISVKSVEETSGDQPNKTGSTYLMQVKDRLQIQMRLVELTYKLAKSGVCYILITPTNATQFISVIERSRLTKVADRIVSKKGMDSARASHVQIVEGGGQSENQFLLRIL